MAGYNTSYAYDLSDFEDEARQKTTSPELKVVKNRHRITSSILSPGVICAFVIIITLISLMVYNQVQLNILTSEMNELATELETLQSDNVKMNSMLESTISMQKLKELATELGMQKRDEYQTERIYLYQEDKIERSETPAQSTGGQVAKLAVTTLFSRFKEYLTGN